MITALIPFVPDFWVVVSLSTLVFGYYKGATRKGRRR